MSKQIIDYLADKNIAILGFGREGKSTYHFIRKHLKEKRLTIIDKDEQILNDFNSDKYLDFVLGDGYLDNLDKYDLVIKTPGISLKDRNLSNITCQLELTLKYYKDNIIGITGTKGKSTTTSLIYQILKSQKDNVYLLGNIGIPIFDYIDEINSDSLLVIEMSAQQLEYVHYSPKYGIILNLFEEHLDYFQTKEKYFQTKLKMFEYQDKEDFAIYYEDNETLNNYVDKKYLGKKIMISSINKTDIYINGEYIYHQDKQLYNINDKRHLLGNHNLVDIMFALAISELYNLDNTKVVECINNFQGLEHRLECIGEYCGIIYYNDAIATIPEATKYAIETLKSVNTLIFGGMNRGINYQEFAEFLARSNIHNLVCLKDSGYKIGHMIEKIGTKNKVIYVKDLKEAVEYAKKYTEKGKICLLSPAAPSYNEFKNFEEKGNTFKKLVIGG